MRLALCLMATVVATFASANDIDCDTGEFASSPAQCWETEARKGKDKVESLIDKIYLHPNSLPDSNERLALDQDSWLGLVEGSCDTNAKCTTVATRRRAKALENMLDDLGPVQAAGTEECLDVWIGAFRKAQGDEASIIASVIDHWSDLCTQGKLPSPTEFNY